MGSPTTPAEMQSPLLKSSRPGSYLGYSLQATRMCLHLCEAPRGSFVALEVLDDVDVVLPDGTRLLEQSKSGLATNPIANFSVDLWKTFSNWIEAIEVGVVDPAKTLFRIYVLQEKKGEYASALHYAHTTAQVDMVVQSIKEDYETEQHEGCKPYIERFLAYDREKLAALVMAFELETGNDQLVERIKDHLALTVPNEFLDDACDTAVGWVKNTSDGLISQRKYPAISRDEFSDRMSTFNTRFSYNHLLKYALPAPPADEVEKSRSSAHILIRQLELIEEQGEGLQAMTDFLHSKTNKVNWGAKGLVYEPEFDEFKQSLLTQWKLFNKEVRLQSASASEVDKGQLLHLKCMAATAKLNDVDSPGFFVRGTYHDFSNAKEIGWHPRYRDLLDE
ncbi:ABC-three component system protein [Pseudomonas poae]|uniref:ABC-three component system protein n=1 Tax=Pseudomonas poae TaxID=200451 RepID=UPI0030D551EC